MNLCNNALHEDYLLVVLNKSTDSLYLNDLGVGIARQTIHLTYFDPSTSLRTGAAQYKYLHTTCSDATRGHLMDVSCGQKSNDSKFHVENVGSNNRFGGRWKAWQFCTNKNRNNKKSKI